MHAPAIALHCQTRLTTDRNVVNYFVGDASDRYCRLDAPPLNSSANPASPRRRRICCRDLRSRASHVVIVDYDAAPLPSGWFALHAAAAAAQPCAAAAAGNASQVAHLEHCRRRACCAASALRPRACGWICIYVRLPVCLCACACVRHVCTTLQLPVFQCVNVHRQ